MTDDKTGVLLREVLDRVMALDGRIANLEERLDVLDVNWKRTLRTWVRLERQGQDREQRLDRIKKNSTTHSSTWTLSTMK